MPTYAQLLERLGRRPKPTYEIGENLFETTGHRPGRGVLGTLGWILDTPGRGIRSLLTGKWGATGADVLASLGLRRRAPQKGFDVPALGVEMLLDPLMFLGGIGTLTKAGRAAKGLAEARVALQPLGLALKDAIKAKNLAEIAKARTALREAGAGALAYKKQLKALGIPEELGATWAEQAQRGQRQLLGLDIPWGPKAKLQVPGEEAALTALEKLGLAAKASPPGQALSRIFNLRHGRPTVTEPMYRQTEQRIGAARIDALSELRRREEEIAKIAKATGMSPEEAGLRIYRGTEAYTVPEKAGAQIERLLERKGRQQAGLEQKFRTTREKYVTERAAQQAEKLKTQADLLWKMKEYMKAHGLDWERMRRLGSAAERAKHLTPAEIRKLGAGLERIEGRYARFTEPLEAGIEKARGILGEVPAGAEHLPREFAEGLEKGLRLEQVAGAPSTRIQDRLVGYMHRLATPAFRQHKGSIQDPFIRSLREQAVTHGAQIRREPALGGKYIDEANKAIKAGGVPMEAFSTNPALSYSYRRLLGEQAVANAQLGRALARKFGKTVDEVPNGVPVTTFFEKAGIKAPIEELTDKVLEPEIAAEFLNVHKKLSNPEELSKLGKVLEGFRRVTSQWLLIPFPAYHTRNWESNVFTTWLAGLASPTNYLRAIKEYRDPALREVYEKLGVLRGGVTREISGAAAQREFRERIFEGAPSGAAKYTAAENIPGVGKVFQAGYKLGDFVEGTSRIAHYLGARQAGMSTADAVNSVRKYLFNAQELTDIEKKYLRPFIFFYSWNRKMVQRLGESFFEHPQKMAAMSRLVTQPSVDRTALPEWLRTTAAIPTGKDLQGNATYLSGLGTPLEALQQLDIFTGAKPGATGHATRALEKLFSLASPPYKQLAEVTAGKDFRLQRPIEELDKAYPAFPFTHFPGYKVEKMPGGTERARAHPEALYWARQLPISRILSDIGRGTDPTKTRLQQILNTLTGLKTVSINEKAELSRALETALEQRLREKVLGGEAKRFQGFFARGVPEEKDPETQMLLQLLRKVQEARKAG